jgi:hypothetical protein
VLAVAAAALGMERASDRGAAEGVRGLAASALAWALLLGPSNPARAVALAWTLLCLREAGAGAATRAATAAALVPGMALLARYG